MKTAIIIVSVVSILAAIVALSRVALHRWMRGKFWPFVIVLAIPAVAGCSTPGDTTPKPRQAEAVDLVWRQMYGQSGPAPEIEWHHSDRLWDGVKGFTLAGWKVLVCDDLQPPETFRFSSTELAHELFHEVQFERLGDVDPLHFRGDWTVAEDAAYVLLHAGL